MDNKKTKDDYSLQPDPKYQEERAALERIYKITEEIFDKHGIKKEHTIKRHGFLS